jgi:hypothetical protein
LGYKTLAEGVIRMDAVLQKSMDMTIDLSDTGKNGRPGFPIATIRATQVSSSPVDQDNKNNNSVLISGEELIEVGWWADIWMVQLDVAFGVVAMTRG